MIKKYIFAIALGTAFVSCTEDVMDDINHDNHHPLPGIVAAKFQVTDAIMSTAFTTLGGDYSFYVSSYTEQLFGTGNNQLARAELRNRGENSSSTTFNNVWGGTYGTMLNIKQMIEKCSPGGLDEGKLDLRGMGEVLWVLNAGTLTDMHGDIPYSEALVELQPKLDKQEDIYADLLIKIDQAIADLEEATSAGMKNAGAQDILFNGNPSKWLGLAYAVKARLLLNLSYRNPSNFAQIITIGETALAKGFAGAELKVFNGVDCDNAWSAFFWSRYYTGANGTLYDILDEREDPRIDIYAYDGFGSGVAYAPAGDDALATETQFVGFPMWLDNGAQSIHIVSASDLYFTIAEAKARLGQDASAEFAAGIQASFDDYAASSNEELGSAADYIAALNPSLEEIMVQKYIAGARDEQLQSYNDMRRFMAEGTVTVALKNPHNEVSGMNQWPLRLPYGNSDVLSNPNVTAAFGTGNEAGNYLYTEPIWIFGGSR